jgi:high-affinity iron transporter
VRDDAARAVEALRLGQISPAAAALSVRRDGLDALQRSATVLVSRSALAGYGRRDAERVQAATIAVGYWSRLAPAYAPLVAPAAAAQARQAFASLAATGGGAPTTWQVDAAATAATGALGAFSAAPLTEAERARRAQQLVRLTSQTISQLCDANAPARRQRGLAGEGATGPSAIARVIADLRPGLSSADSARLAALTPDLQALPQAAGILGEEGAPPAASVPARATELCDRLSATVSDVFPGPWRRLGGDADLDRIEAALQRMQDAAAAGRWGDANRARREAYSIFELGPELRLRAFAPDLAVRLEGLFWASAPDGPNLVDVLAPGTPPALVRQRREATVAALEQARAALDRPRSGSAVVVNSAIVVFREGLEAALILAALAATFAFGGRAWRRPLVLGMLAALPATLVTWFVTTQVVRSFAGYGLAVEAVLDLLALLVLVIILAWFFQRFCWTRFVVRQQARHRRVLALRSSSGPALALALLGFTAIYREGFETVIYLQALRLDAGTGTVLQGVLLGIALTAVLAVLMLRLRRRLPYRTIVVIAASGIALLTVIVAGQAARAAQAAGWLAVTPLDIRVPAWAGPWLGMYPAAQTLIAQVLAAVGVVVLGLAVRARREQRAARRMQLARSRKAKATG